MEDEKQSHDDEKVKHVVEKEHEDQEDDATRNVPAHGYWMRKTMSRNENLTKRRGGKKARGRGRETGHKLTLREAEISQHALCQLINGFDRYVPGTYSTHLHHQLVNIYQSAGYLAFCCTWLVICKTSK